MPIYAVPKPHSEKLRLVNNHSASKYSLNSMVDHSEVTGYPMDSLAQFGEQLVKLRKEQLDLQKPDSVVVWKSDISEAYRICPLHPFWQLKQGVRIGDDVHVDQCIVFDSSASPAKGCHLHCAQQLSNLDSETSSTSPIHYNLS